MPKKTSGILEESGIHGNKAPQHGRHYGGLAGKHHKLYALPKTKRKTLG